MNEVNPLSLHTAFSEQKLNTEILNENAEKAKYEFIKALVDHNLTIDDLSDAEFWGGRYDPPQYEPQSYFSCKKMMEITREKYNKANRELEQFPPHRSQCLCGNWGLYWNCYWYLPKKDLVIGVDIPYPVGSCCNKLLYGFSPSQEFLEDLCNLCRRQNVQKKFPRQITKQTFQFTCRECKKILKNHNNDRKKARKVIQQQVLDGTLLEYGEKAEIVRVRLFIVGHSSMKFGKYRGKKINEVPDDYLKWFYNASKLFAKEKGENPFEAYCKAKVEHMREFKSHSIT